MTGGAVEEKGESNLGAEGSIPDLDWQFLKIYRTFQRKWLCKNSELERFLQDFEWVFCFFPKVALQFRKLQQKFQFLLY